MKSFKQIIIVLILGAVAVGGYYGWQAYNGAGAETTAQEKPKARAVTVETAQAAFRELDVLIEAVGSTRAIRTVEITPLAAGRVTELGFTVGKPVEKGQILLRLDDDIQRADLTEAEARLKDAENNLQRSEALRKSNAVSVATVETLTAQLAIAKAQRDRARRRLADRTVRAPFDGIVGFTNVELGSRVEEGDVVTVLDDLSVMEVEFSLPEMLFGKVELGKRVVADAAAFPGRKFEGKIEQIDSRIDPVSRAFKARAIVKNEDKTLPSGMFVHLSVVLDAEQALVVPEEAVIVDGTRAYLFAVVKNDDKTRAERRFVALGRRAYGVVEILEGVKEGDSVIIRGHQKVRDGVLVQSKSEETPPKAPKEEAPTQAGS